MGGRKPTISDKEILEIFAGAEWFLWTKEVEEELGFSTAGTLKRLRQLEEDGYLRSKSTGNSIAWDLTEAGRELVEEDDG